MRARLCSLDLRLRNGLELLLYPGRLVHEWLGQVFVLKYSTWQRLMAVGMCCITSTIGAYSPLCNTRALGIHSEVYVNSQAKAYIDGRRMFLFITITNAKNSLIYLIFTYLPTS